MKMMRIVSTFTEKHQQLIIFSFSSKFHDEHKLKELVDAVIVIPIRHVELSIYCDDRCEFFTWVLVVAPLQKCLL